MSGDGDHRKENEELEKTKEDEDNQADQPTNQTRRPMTARTRRQSAARIRTISNSRSSMSDPPGAVGGEGSSYTRHLNEQEKRVGGQAQMLLEMLIVDRMQKERLSPHQRDIVQDAVCHPDAQQGKQSASHNDDYLEDVSSALRDIGDQLSQDYDLNRLIDMVPIQSPREIFMKVCKQMFQDGQFNWGRVCALFYFAYRLIAKAIKSTVDTGIPWIKEIFKWTIDFFLQYVAWWIIQRGGWRMIREYWGTSSTTLTALGVTAILTVVYVWWKHH